MRPPELSPGEMPEALQDRPADDPDRWLPQFIRDEVAAQERRRRMERRYGIAFLAIVAVAALAAIYGLMKAGAFQ